MKALENAINRINNESIMRINKELEWAKNRHPSRETDDEYVKGLKSGLKIGIELAQKEIRCEFKLEDGDKG